MRKTRQENHYETLAIVLLPEHLHTIWQLPVGDADYSTRWRKIERYFTEALLEEGIVLHKNHHGEYDLWQRRFWEHRIRNEQDMAQHIDYIHYNPVKHGLVKQVSDWPYSSFHRHVRRGVLALNWCGVIEESTGSFGE
nr:hypothetical protein [Legionella tunisiensis]